MSISVLIGTSHFTRKYNPQAHLYFKHNISISGYGIDTYFLRIAKFISRHKQSKYTWLIEIPCNGRYHEWINEDNYRNGDFVKKEFDLKDYSFFYSKTQDMGNWLAIDDQLRSGKKKVIGGANAIRTLSKVKVFSNERLEFDDILCKCSIIDGYLKNQGHVVNWVSVNGFRNVFDYPYFKKLTKPMSFVLKDDLRNYICKKHGLEHHASLCMDGSHFTEETWKELWPVILRDMKYV